MHNFVKCRGCEGSIVVDAVMNKLSDVRRELAVGGAVAVLQNTFARALSKKSR